MHALPKTPQGGGGVGRQPITPVQVTRTTSFHSAQIPGTPNPHQDAYGYLYV